MSFPVGSTTFAVGEGLATKVDVLLEDFAVLVDEERVGRVEEERTDDVLRGLPEEE